jgi:hypothetical protein
MSHRCLAVAAVAANLLAMDGPALAQANAQLPANARRAPSESIVDLAGGAAWWFEDGSTYFGPAGSVAVHPAGSPVGIAADFAYYEPGRPVRFGDFTIKQNPRYSLMAGVRVRFPTARVTPFAQFLIGHAPLDDLALQPGGGIDWFISPRLGVRAAADFKIAGDDGETYKGGRLLTGIALRLF